MNKIEIVNIDMDGVLTDWEPLLNRVTGLTLQQLKDLPREKQIEYTEVLSCEIDRHYADMLPLHENVDLIRNMLVDFSGLIEFRILTSVGKHNVESMICQKMEWLSRYMPEFDMTKFRYTLRSKDKAYYATPNSAIIDDFDLVRTLYEANGGHVVDGSDINAIRDFIQRLKDEYKDELYNPLREPLDKLADALGGCSFVIFDDFIRCYYSVHTWNIPLNSGKAFIPTIGEYIEHPGPEFIQFFEKFNKVTRDENISIRVETNGVGESYFKIECGDHCEEFFRLSNHILKSRLKKPYITPTITQSVRYG